MSLTKLLLVALVAATQTEASTPGTLCYQNKIWIAKAYVGKMCVLSCSTIRNNGNCSGAFGDGWKLKTQRGCNFLNFCEGYCYYDGPAVRDYGCGCGEGTSCLPVDCKVSEWSDWGHCLLSNDSRAAIPCDPSGSQLLRTGVRQRTRKVLVEAENGGAECPSKLKEQKACDNHNCEPHVNCQVSAWSPWTDCTKKCGGGNNLRVREVLQEPANGGNSCPALQETSQCNTDYCYYFTLKGKSGNEIVEVNGSRYELKQNVALPIGTNHKNNVVNFVNYKSKYGVLFKYHHNLGTDGRPVQITPGITPAHSTKWNEWNCGKNNEHNNCQKVRNGEFLWGGEYVVVFI